MLAHRSSILKERHIPTSAVLLLFIAGIVFLCLFPGCSDKPENVHREKVRTIVTSDTILADMAASLLPPGRYCVAAILPPGQCPGHYDVKLADIEKMKRATLNVTIKGMPFVDKAGLDDRAQLVIDPGTRNLMAPDSYVYGLGLLADGLSKRFPEDRAEIARRKEDAVSELRSQTGMLLQKIRHTRISGNPVIVSSMQKEPLEWMGFRVVGEYGRPEAMSAKDIVRLARIGRDRKAIMVVDNLQSGPDTGKGIAETLKIAHVVLTNFPSEKGYLATLSENVDALLAAVRK